MRYTFTFLFVLFISALFAQTRIDATVNFQTDPEKQYSIYVPSTYDENAPNKMMVGLHPLNTSRWNSISWCDTLIAFAEANDLLLICPDGGADGAIDDPIDTAFTTFIIDSMLLWYNVNESKIFAMGFSWGGRTTYTYGLNHVDRFAGFMPIGAAINGLQQVDGIIQNAIGKPYYIVHGSNDSPNSRFFPIRDELIDQEACVEDNYLTGVGHTIDFPNRNAILTEGFMWLDSVSCGIVNAFETTVLETKAQLFPNPSLRGQDVQLQMDNGLIPEKIRVFDKNGKEIDVIEGKTQISTTELPTGLFFIRITTNQGELVKRLMVF